MGSVTIIVIIPLFFIMLLASSLIGAVTGGDRTEVVLPYEPEKGIIWDCDVPDETVELVETEIDGNTQVFFFKSNSGMEMLGYFADIAKELITKDYSDPKYTYGDLHKITFTDANGNEQIYYAESELNTESIYIDTLKIYAPDEYYAFDYTVTAQQPIEGEYGWFNKDHSFRTEYYKADYSPARTFTIVHTGDIENDEEYYYLMGYGPIDGFEKTTEYVVIKYKFTNGEHEIFEEKHVTSQN